MPRPAVPPPARPGAWYFGYRSAGRWVNMWLDDPCRDLAQPFELGPRVYHHREA